jgi:carbon monoxide dehydrogenase subunit G
MEITEQTRIAAPLAEVWPLLRDPASVVACIPGAELAPDQGDGIWRGGIRVRFGPTAAVFRGEATLDFDDDRHRCVMEGRGIDQRGASRALANGTIEAEAGDDATTRLTVQGSFAVTGPLETFANAGGVHLARTLLTEFSTNMAELIAERRGPAAADASPPAALGDASFACSPSGATMPPPRGPVRELNAMTLLWRAFRDWLRSLFSRGIR